MLFHSFICVLSSDLYSHWTRFSFFILLGLLIACRRLSFLTLLNSLSLAVDRLRVSPQLELVPIEDKKYREDELDEA